MRKNKNKKKQVTKKMENYKNEKVNIENKVVGKIDMPTINVKEHIGKEVSIENCETYKHEKYGYSVRINTEIIQTYPEIISKTNNKPVELRGSKLFGLYDDGNGNLGWGENTKLGLFLKKKGVKH